MSSEEVLTPKALIQLLLASVIKTPFSTKPMPVHIFPMIGTRGRLTLTLRSRFELVQSFPQKPVANDRIRSMNILAVMYFFKTFLDSCEKCTNSDNLIMAAHPVKAIRQIIDVLEDVQSMI